MSRSIAHIETEHASTYLQQLCKHFAHKLPVEFTPSQGRIPFAAGTCTLAADDAKLTLEAEAASADDLAHVQDIVERHLVRFAFREPPTVRWTVVAAAE
jgi:hypothetical protein